MGDRAAQSCLGAVQALVQAQRDLIDVCAQRLERALHLGGVRGQVALAVLPQHQPLRAAQAAHADQQRQRGQQRHRGHAGGGDRDDAARVGDRGGDQR